MVITVTILVCDLMVFVLFDRYSTLSHESMKFAIGWDIDCEYLHTFMYMSKLIRVSMCADQIYHMCYVMFMGFKTLSNYHFRHEGT